MTHAEHNVHSFLGTARMQGLPAPTTASIAQPPPFHDGRCILTYEIEECRLAVIIWEEDDTYSFCCDHGKRHVMSGDCVPLSLPLPEDIVAYFRSDERPRNDCP